MPEDLPLKGHPGLVIGCPVCAPVRRALERLNEAVKQTKGRFANVTVGVVVNDGLDCRCCYNRGWVLTQTGRDIREVLVKLAPEPDVIEVNDGEG